MENINYKKIEKFKKLFQCFSLDALESVDVLLAYTNGLKELKLAYLDVYKEKYEACKEELEGINEYDFISQIANFNLSEIRDMADSFDKEELLSLKELLENALYESKNTFPKEQIKELKECKNAIEKKLILKKFH